MSSSINESALTYWKHTGYTTLDVHEVGRKLDRERMFGVVEFRGKEALHVAVSNNLADRAEGHAITWIKFFEEVASSWKEEPLVGRILVWAEDAMFEWERDPSAKVPVFAFGKHEMDSQSLLIPDPTFMQSRGHLADLARLDEVETSMSWFDKKPIVFWRGANSGLYMNAPDDNWKKASRMRLALVSKEFNNLNVLDAAISKVVDQGDEHFTKRVYELGVVKDYIPFEDFLSYRYQVDVDGISCAWLSCFLKLASKSLMLKVQSPYKQWYYGDLLPWKHYVPVASDLRDLIDVIDWIGAHQEAAQHIAEAGRSFIREYTYERVLQETGQLIAEVLKCQKD